VPAAGGGRSAEPQDERVAPPSARDWCVRVAVLKISCGSADTSSVSARNLFLIVSSCCPPAALQRFSFQFFPCVFSALFCPRIVRLHFSAISDKLIGVGARAHTNTRGGPRTTTRAPVRSFRCRARARTLPRPLALPPPLTARATAI